MRIAFELSINLLESFLILEFLAEHFGFHVSEPKKYYGFILLWLCSFGSVSFFSWEPGLESGSIYAQVLLNFLFCAWLLKGNRKDQAFMSAFVMCCIMLISSFTAFLFGHLPGQHWTTILNQFGPIRMIAVLTSKVLFFQVTRVLLRIKKHVKLEKTEIFTLAVLPVLSIIIISILVTAVVDMPQVQNLFFFAVCILMGSNVLTYYLFVQLGKSAEMKQELELLNLQYDCAQKNAEDIQNLYDKIRAVRHDMSNHLSCIASMLHGQEEEARQYIENLLKQQNAEYRTFVFSGNAPLDAMINLKESEAHKNHIRFESLILDPLTFMAPEDICVLMGNLFDNALEAACQSEGRRIFVRTMRQGAYVSIVVKNSIAEPVLLNNPDLHTTKGDHLRHGLGIRNIRRIVQKYDGMMEFLEKGYEFTCDILLRHAK